MGREEVPLKEILLWLFYVSKYMLERLHGYIEVKV